MSNIYSLVSIDKECPECQHVHSISYSREILEDMTKNIHPNELTLADFIIKENMSVYFLTKLNNKFFLTKTLSKKINKDKLYAFNKITTYNVENCILDISGFKIEELKDLNTFKDIISNNIIQFDTYYEEGIMNA
jgi:hypothetical protein